MSDISGTGKSWGTTLLADARQGIIGGLAYLIVGALAVLLFSVLGGEVPTWTLGGMALAGTIVLFVTVSIYERRIAGLEGEVTGQSGVAAGLQSALDSARAQLLAATQGEVPLSPQAQGLIRRVRALREDVETARSRPYSFVASATQERAYLALVDTFDEIFGPSTTTRHAREAVSDETQLDDLLTMLGQLETFAMSVGAAT